MQKESEEMIRKYSLAKDGAKLLAPDFKVQELRCRDGSDTVMVDEALTVVLQCIREHFGKPVTITSGYRTAAHNAAVGGAKSSQHLLAGIIYMLCKPYKEATKLSVK